MTEKQFLNHMKLDFIPKIQRKIKTSTFVNGQYYNYKSLNSNGTKWEADDYSILNCDITKLLLVYAFDDPIYHLEGINPNDFIENNMKNLKELK